MVDSVEFKFRRLLEVEQVVTDFKFIREYFGEEYVEPQDITTMLDLAYKREIHNRDYNQATSHFDKQLKLNKEMWYIDNERGEDSNGT